MNRIRYFNAITLAACLLAITPVTLFAQDSATSETAKLVAVLTSDADTFAKAKACQRLVIIGDESAVPALAGLLADEKLSAYARDALEGIPGPAADVALREALSRLDGERLVGVLGSIGARRDVAAIDAVVKLLGSDDAGVAAAAARALGYIGTPAAADILQKTLAEATAKSGPALGKACMICIQQLAKQGAADKAVALCEAVQNADVPQYMKLGATRSAIAAMGQQGLPRLAQLLDSEDESQFRLALHVARQLGDDVDASSVLVASFKEQPPARQALLLIALRDLGNKAVLPTVVEAAKSGEREVRIEAIRTLAQLGDATVVPVLLEAATESDEQIAGAARSTLAVLKSDEINAAITKMLDSDDAKTLQMAIEMAAGRKITSAAPALLKLAGGTDATIRAAAIGALGSTARLDDLSDFIALAIAAEGSDEFPAVQSALKAACVRMPQQPCAEKLTAAMSGASTGTKVFLLEQLTSIGGPTALKTVVAAAKSNHEAMQDAATRLLGAWLTADAAPAMFDLAKTLKSNKYKIRALRGYVRIARQLNMTPEQRIAVCRNTLSIAKRSDDKVLVFEVVRRYPTPEGLALAASLLGDEDLRKFACSTIVSMAGRVAAEAPELTEKALLQVLELTTYPAQKADAEKALAIARDGIRLKKEEAQFTRVFDGVSLKGWTQPGKVYRVEEGAIVGGSLEKAIGGGNDYLCLDGDYGDFELRLEARIKGTADPNGGIYIRSSRTAGIGYQVDLGAELYGSLYDEVRRSRMLAHADPKPKIETGQWVDYRIRCEGPRIRIWINGAQTVDYTEKEAGIAMSGAIGLQSHANHPNETWYRNIRVRKLDEGEPDEKEFTSLFDGKTFDGWKGNMDFWRVADGAVVGGSLTEMVKNNEFLRSEREYGDFELRLQFKLLGKQTNGGVQIRTAEIPNHHEVSGYQADLGDGWWGCLYDESRRNRLLAGPPAAERGKSVRIGQWNDYRIRCEGPRIQLWINGEQTVDYTEQDANIPLSGIIAPQVHGNLKMEAYYRNIRIKEL